MKGVDTNVLVRLLTRDDPGQFRRSKAALEQLAARSERARIDAIVLCELAWVLESSYQFDRASVADALSALLEVETFQVDERESVLEAIARSRTSGGDFSDHLLGLRNRRGGCSSTLTFDRKLRSSEDFEAL